MVLSTKLLFLTDIILLICLFAVRMPSREETLVWLGEEVIKDVLGDSR